MSELLTREQILQKTGLQSQLVEVPEWGGTVKVCELSAGARMDYEWKAYGKAKKDEAPNSSIKVLLVVACVRDREGNLLFSDDDVVSLTNGGSGAIERVYDVAARLNHLTAKDVEEIKGN